LRQTYSKFQKELAAENKEKGTRGIISMSFEQMSLTTRWIAIAVTTAVLLFLCFTVLLFSASAVYSDELEENGNIFDWVPSVLVPFASFSKGLNTVRAKQKEVDDKSGAPLAKFRKLL